MSLVTPAEYARTKGLNRSAISRAMTKGRIPFVVDAANRKMIDPEAADKALAALTDPDQKARGDGNKPTRDHERWIGARVGTERLKAELLAIQLAEEKGEIVRRAVIEAELAPMLIAMRDELLGVASRCAPLARAQQTDAAAARVIDNAIREAMRHIGARIPEAAS